MAAQGMEGNGQNASAARGPKGTQGSCEIPGTGRGVGTPQEGPSAVPGHERAARVAKNYIRAAGDKRADAVR